MTKLFDYMFNDGIIYRASGVCLNGLEEETTEQISFFKEDDTKRMDKISIVWDKIEEKFGRGAIKIINSRLII